MSGSKEFEELARPSLRDEFQRPRLTHRDPTVMNRAAFPVSYFRFWSPHVVVQTSDPNVQPVRVKLGAEHWARCAPPPFHQSTLIADHMQDWMRERRARIWYSALVLPAGAFAF